MLLPLRYRLSHPWNNSISHNRCWMNRITILLNRISGVSFYRIDCRSITAFHDSHMVTNTIMIPVKKDNTSCCWDAPGYSLHNTEFPHWWNSLHPELLPDYWDTRYYKGSHWTAWDLFPFLRFPASWLPISPQHTPEFHIRWHTSGSSGYVPVLLHLEALRSGNSP